MADNPDADILQLTTKIVSAHISHNTVETDALPGLIQSVYRSMTMAGITGADRTPLTPAVPVRKSVLPDYIVCLEDGKKLKMLKRHLQTSYGMTPEQYRQKWGRPVRPKRQMTAPAQFRSTLAEALPVNVTIPVGVLGVAPVHGAVLTVDNGMHGGNLDVQEITPGSKVMFAVHQQGAALYVGDCPATPWWRQATPVTVRLSPRKSAWAESRQRLDKRLWSKLWSRIRRPSLR